MAEPSVNSRLPEDLARWAEVIAQHARDEGLDFFETLFEMLDPDQITQVAAYGGFPQRYPHWRFGMEYERLQRSHRYGLSKIYEMVINNNPCYAYLMNDSHPVDYKTVIAHVYAHCDFFKNNVWFSHTNRRMIDEMANHATRIRRYIDRHGLDVVERFIDTCLAIEDLIDPHSLFVRRDPPFHVAGTDDPSPTETRFPAKEYMEDYINPPGTLAKERLKRSTEEQAQRLRFPATPVRDVLFFLLESAPLDDWESDILSIIREEAYYFAPQGQTKIMNEGWASYWHSTIMTRYCLQADEVITYCDHHSGTLATSPGRLNPYKLGVELFRDIEDRWNTGRHGVEYERCDNIEKRRAWKTHEPPERPVVGKRSPGREKIFEVRRIYNDVTFIDAFMTPEFMEEQKLYHYRMDPATGKMVTVSRDFHKIKQQMLFMLTNHARPYIYVVDGNYRNRGELYLAHKHVGVDLEMKFLIETLKNIEHIWNRPVHLHTLIDDDPVLFSFDGEQSTQQRVDDSVDEPANKL